MPAPCTDTHSVPIPGGQAAPASGRGESAARAIGLIMSPQTWTALSTHPYAAEPEEGARLFGGVPVWLRLDGDGVEVVSARGEGAPTEPDTVWI